MTKKDYGIYYKHIYICMYMKYIYNKTYVKPPRFYLPLLLNNRF